MSSLQFGQPWILLLLALIPLALGTWLFGLHSVYASAATLTRNRLPRPPYLAVSLFAVVAALALIAAARPQWGTEAREVPLVGADLVVVLDVSRSMDARDVAPSRIAAARDAIRATFDRLGGDRIGLVIFAGDARIRFPLTTDLDAAIRVLDTIETGQLFVEGGSAAAAALDMAATAFDRDRDAGRLVLLITDGDDLGPDPGGSARRLAEQGIALMVAGVGTPAGATIPIVNRAGETGPKLDASGEPIITRLNEPFLRSLAAAAEGRYIGSDLAAVPGAVASRLDALKQAQFDQRPADAPVERFPVFAAGALLALVLAIAAENLRLPALGRSRAALAAAALVAVLLGAAACVEDAHVANREGIAAFENGDLESAIQRFSKAQAAKPGNLQVSLNLAAALHASGRYDDAARVARRATLAPGIALRARAYASIGHHRFALGQLDESLEAFREALLLRPENETYRRDYEVVLRLLNPLPPADDEPAPGEDPTPPGEGDDDGEPGGDDGPPEPGATPASSPGDSPGDNGPGSGDSPGGFTTSEEVEAELDRIDEQVRLLQLEAGEAPTLSEALEILDLLAERSRLAILRESLGRSGGPGDY